MINWPIILLLVLSSITTIAILFAIAMSRATTSESKQMAEEPIATEGTLPEGNPRSPSLSPQ